MTNRDYYELLGLSRGAGLDEIKKAYRKLAQKYHPDRNPGNKESENKFKDINEAYQVLSDPQKKEQYDRFGFVGGPGQRPGGPQPGYTYYTQGASPDFDFNLEDLVGGFNRKGPGQGRGRKNRSRIEDMFGDLFGGGGGAEPGYEPAGGEDMEAALSIDFMDAVNGGVKNFQVNGENISVRVPPGVRNGGRLRIPGKGRPRRRGGRGDLFLQIQVNPHAYFRREENDIHLDTPVTVWEAALGSTIEVPTVEGWSKLKVPPGSQGGTVLRMSGKGVADPKSGRRGDEYVHLQVVVPKQVDAKTKELLEELAKHHPENPRKDRF